MSTFDTFNSGNVRYKVLGEDYMRKVPNRQPVIMVRRSDGERRDAIPSLLMQLPDFKTSFSPKAQEFIKHSAKRATEWLARRSKKVEPIRPETNKPLKLRLYINKNFC